MCLLAVTLFAYWELQKEAHGRLTLYLASVVVVGVVSGYMVRTVWKVFDGVAWAITTPHNVEHFFLGQVLYDPGWLYLPVGALYKYYAVNASLSIRWVSLSVEETSSGRVCATVSDSTRVGSGCPTVHPLSLLTSKKFSRYLLPAFPILEILAALGFFEFLKWGYSYIGSRFGTGATRPKTHLFYCDHPLSFPNPDPARPTASPLLRHLLQPLLQTH